MLSIGKLLLLVLMIHCTVLSGQETSSLGVRFERSPESAVAPKGDEVVFECEFNLKPDHLEWRFRSAHNQNTFNKNLHYVNVQENITNEDRASKIRIFVSAETIGEYQCVAWIGSAAIASTSARLTLALILIDDTLDNRSRNNIRYNVAPKNYVIIRCGNVISNPPAIWTFYHNGQRIESPDVYNGAMVLNVVTAKDSGEYSCSAINTIIGNEVNLMRKIDLHVGYSDRTPPYFLDNPAREISTRVGESILLECPGVGSPPPVAVWSSPNITNIYNNRTQKLPYGLRINNVVVADQGSYICRLDNGIAPAPVHMIKLNVFERPKIFKGPPTTLTNEGDALELECTVSGNPSPEIFWLINGADTSFDNETYQDGEKLYINHVQKRHAGIVQCVARNDLGEVSHGSLLQVKPTQISGDEDSETLGNVPARLGNDHSNNKNKKRKFNKANMIPPSRPIVTRLSDNAVMLRWNVAPNLGLPIEFFKVQYRMLGDAQHTIPRESWQTTNEEIPFGKPESNDKVIKNFTSSVVGLKAGRFYRFRIIAVYSNNDNKEGGVSNRFLLQYGSELEPYASKLPCPQLSEIEPVSENSVRIHWVLPDNHTNNKAIDGFYAYYRPASSAGDYLKITIDGANTQKHKIDMLESDTTYEFKLQSFNAVAASEFSTIKQGKTKKLITIAPSVIRPEIKKNEINTTDNPSYVVTAGITGLVVILLIITFITIICIKRRKISQITVENKPQLAHIRTDFVAASVLGSPNHHKNRHTHMNGVLPHMNITPNPLAQTADKDNKTELSSVGWDYQPPIQLHQSHNATLQNKNNFNNHHQHHHHHHNQHQHQNPDFYQQHYLSQQLSASGLPSTAEYHGLLECNASTLHCRPQEHKTSNIDTVAVRKPPLHPGGCHALGMDKNEHMHNTSHISMGADGSTRIQPSPKPSRTTIKRSRMGNAKMNMSSGSLDSIEV